MKKILIISTTLLTIVAFSALLDHLPQNYTSFVYISDVQKLYNTFKKLPLGNAVMNDLGLEAMISSMLETYEIDPNSLSKVKEALVVANGELPGFVFAIGPIEKAQDLSYLLQNTLQSLYEGQKINIKVDNMGNYLVVYSNDDFFNEFLKGGGKYEDDPIFHKADAVGIGYSKYNDVKAFSVIYTTKSSIESEMKVVSKEATEYLKPYKKLSPNDLLKGDVLIVLNAKNVKGLVNKIEEISGQQFLKKDEKENLPESGYVVAGIDINDIISSSIEEAMSGSTNTTVETVPNALVKISSSTPIEDEAEKNCEKIATHKYKCEDTVWKFIDPKTAIMSMGKKKPSGDAVKFFKEVQNGNEFLVVAWDMSGALKSLGLDMNSYLMIRGWLEKGIVRLHAQLK